MSTSVRRSPLAQGEAAVPTTSPGLMKRVQQARDHLRPFLTDRREEVPDPLREVLQEALDALNEVLLQSFILRSVRLLSFPERCGGEVRVWTSRAVTLRRKSSCGASDGRWPTRTPIGNERK